MYAKTKYRAAWDPTKHLKIGYIGKLQQGVISIYSSLDKEGIPLEVATSISSAAMDYSSQDSVVISAKLSGEIPVPGSALTTADAGFSFGFNSQESIVFQTGNYKVHQLVNLAEIEDMVLRKYKKGNWDRDWVILTELVEAGQATIIISNSYQGVLELKAHTAAGAGKMSLTDASLGLSVVREKGSSLKYIAQDGLTPLYRVMGIQHPFLGNLSLSSKNKRNMQPEERLQLLDFDERELD